MKSSPPPPPPSHSTMKVLDVLQRRVGTFLPWLLLPLSALFLIFTLHSSNHFIFTSEEAIIIQVPSFSEIENTTSSSDHSHNKAIEVINQKPSLFSENNSTIVLTPLTSTSNHSTINQKSHAITEGRGSATLERQFPNGGNEENACNLFAGKWVWDPREPLYTNTSCPTLPDLRNCMKYGKHEGHLYWRWKPDGCELLRFDPKVFLSIVRNKKMAFIGDSLARNHMESLICALSQTETPINTFKDADDKSKTWLFPSHNFTLMVMWTEFLVVRKERFVNGTSSGFNIHLDKIDENWAQKLAELNYVIINNGNWFFRRNHLYESDKLIGCVSCWGERDVQDLGVGFAVRRVIETTLEYISRSSKECNDDLVVLLRTFSPAHFEHGHWFSGGYCNRTQPLNDGHAVLDGLSGELRKIQLEELDIVRGRERGGKRRYRVMDVTEAMAMRVDGHPNSHWTWGKNKNSNDCLHWCLPGAIDMWNDMLLAIIKQN